MASDWYVIVLCGIEQLQLSGDQAERRCDDDFVDLVVPSAVQQSLSEPQVRLRDRVRFLRGARDQEEDLGVPWSRVSFLETFSPPDDIRPLKGFFRTRIE